MRRYLIIAVLLFQFVTLGAAMAQFSVGAQKPKAEATESVSKDTSDPSDMYSCSADSDCIVVGSGCTIIAVNEAYKSQGEAYCDKQNTLVECEKDPGRNFLAKCESNQCVLH